MRLAAIAVNSKGSIAANPISKVRRYRSLTVPYWCSGKRSPKRAPPSGAMPTRMVPRYLVTMRYTMLRPSPVPLPGSLVVKKGSKTCFRSTSGIPAHCPAPRCKQNRRRRLHVPQSDRLLGPPRHPPRLCKIHENLLNLIGACIDLYLRTRLVNHNALHSEDRWTNRTASPITFWRSTLVRYSLDAAREYRDPSQCRGFLWSTPRFPYRA